MARFPKTTFANSAQNLGKAFDQEELDALKSTKFVMNDFVEDERGLIAYQMFTLDKKKIKEGEETEIYYTEEILGHILKYGRTLAERQAGSTVVDAVITIPSYFERE
jgi:molecular chaperone DnaK (HSP70)